MARRLLPAGWQERFFTALEEGYSITYAAKRAGVCRSTVYLHRGRSKLFAERMADAYEAGTDRLEDIALERAVAGSDNMLMFLLKARRPEKYRENYQHQHSFAQEAYEAFERALEILRKRHAKEKNDEQ